MYWIEEALPPDDYDGYAELRRRISWTRITTGEHEYTRFGFHELIQRGCADILQPDLAWCGGITEAHRAAQMAETHGIDVIPHVGATASYHFCLAHANAPMVEFIFRAGDGSELVPVQPFFSGEPLPENGRVRPPEAPGLGLRDCTGSYTGTPTSDVPKAMQMLRPALRDWEQENRTWIPVPTGSMGFDCVYGLVIQIEEALLCEPLSSIMRKVGMGVRSAILKAPAHYTSPRLPAFAGMPNPRKGLRHGRKAPRPS